MSVPTEQGPAPGDIGAASASAPARLALNAPPLLATFNNAGLLAAADVHVARRLGRLTGERDEQVLLAVALAVRAVRAGSVCVRLEDLDALAVPEAEEPGAEAVEIDALPWPAPEAWVRAIQESPLVAVGVDGPADRPVRWVDGRLYLDRYWRDELLVRRAVEARLSGAGRLAERIDDEQVARAARRLFPDGADARQRLAAAVAARSRLTVLTGGPGTGKTTTVARLLAVLQEVGGHGDGGPLRVSLAAPTGKAAARLQEAVHEAVGRLPHEDRERLGQLPASTVHRMLGWRPGSSTRFRHDRNHHLPDDVVVVDETSMVSLPLMARLLEALRPDARLILVGDPDQLASVEAGAVLGDLVARPAATRHSCADSSIPNGAETAGPGAGTPGAAAATEGEHVGGVVVPADLVPDGLDAGERQQLSAGVVRLTRVYRQQEDSRILPLAAAIREGDADRVLDVLRTGGSGVEFVEVTGERLTDAEIEPVRADAAQAGIDLVTAARAGDAAGALEALEAHRLMLAHRRGPAGVAHWAGVVEHWVNDAVGAGSADDTPWYAGRPVLVTANDRETGLYNGDTGVLVASGDGADSEDRDVVAVFGDPRRPVRIRPHRLPAVETVHAMTVHRGQGSQFGTVSLILPPATSPLLTRELLYTAVTRARQAVRVVGSVDAVRAAVERPVRRASGLREPLDGQ
ncbi:exodeoxyribonuclease V subunit alpha [Georgenia deserti]|uniref:RecBCD enzyme subunit RecD n=1 Tax=Georgenia deserti TaxID=2093781 RepID=A0ABW4L2P3_9MICO